MANGDKIRPVSFAKRLSLATSHRPPFPLSWSIRNQILVPFVAVVLIAVMTIAFAAAALAARRSEGQTIAQLRAVVNTLGQSHFPYTQGVLEQMRGLSGAHFVACDAAGQVVASTVSPLPTLPAMRFEDPSADTLTSIGEHPLLEAGDRRYLASAVRTRLGAHPVAWLWVLYPEARWRAARWDAALPPLVVGTAALVLVVALAVWISHRFSQRIGRIRRQVAAIAAGEFQQVHVGNAADEIGQLVVSVNQMSAQLLQMQRTIRQTERGRLLGQLAGGLAHQLRNAATGARMAVQIHARRCSAASGKESLAVALRQLTLIEEQVKGLLAVGQREDRGASSGMPSEQPCCDVERLAHEVTQLVQPTCQHAHVEFAWIDRAGACLVAAPFESARAAVLNLTLNGIEAAGPRGRVSLVVDRAVEGQAEGIRFEIADTGPGPPIELRESLFEAFVTSKPEGVGLGLALVKQLAVDYDGLLSWERDGGMTRFSLWLPLASQPHADDETLPTRIDRCKDQGRSTDSSTTVMEPQENLPIARDGV